MLCTPCHFELFEPKENLTEETRILQNFSTNSTSEA